MEGKKFIRIRLIIEFALKIQDVHLMSVTRVAETDL